MVILQIDIKKGTQSVWFISLISGGDQDDDYEDRLAMAMRDAMRRALVDIQMPPLPGQKISTRVVQKLPPVPFPVESDERE